MKRIKIFFLLSAVFYCQLFSQTSVDSYVIQKGDVLSIAVMGHPEFSVDRIIVLPDGYVQLPGLGSVMASNMTISQFSSLVNTNVSRFVLNPIVTVFVSDLPNQVINVTGFVNRPGQIPVFEKISVMDAISRAGGIKALQKSKVIIIIRKNQIYEKVYVKDIFSDNLQRRTNIELLDAGDTIYVVEPTEFNWSKLSFFASLGYIVISLINILS